MEENVRVNRKKRATSEEPIFLDDKLFIELGNLVNNLDWGYKANREALTSRDRALFAFLFLTGCRISEALALKRKQFRIYSNRIEVVNIVTLKHGLLRAKVILPKSGALKNLTSIFERWLTTVSQEESYIFPRATTSGELDWTEHLGRKRAYQIIQPSGKFPHWARAVCETIYGKKVFNNDAWKLKQFMGLKRLDSTASYVQGSWEENEKDIYQL
jgi:integrase